MTLKQIENWFHGLFTKAEADLINYTTPAMKYIEENGGKEILKIAEGILAGAIAGTPWSTLMASLATQATTAGIQLAEGAAGVVLNTAQSNMIATGAIPALSAS